jgi:glycosyltransferase involved in cell wall biosynthesis
MRLLLLSEFFYPDDTGSTPTDLSDIARYLKDNHEIQIDVITSRNFYRPSSNISLPKEEDWRGIRITRLDTVTSRQPTVKKRFAKGLIFSLSVLREIMKRPPYDVIMVVNEPPTNAFVMRFYKAIRGVPYVYLLHDLYPDIAVALGALSPNGWITRACRQVQRNSLVNASFVLVQGRCMAEKIRDKYGVALPRIRVLTAWANPRSICPESKNTIFRQKQNLSGFIVLYAGHFGE